MLGRLRAQGWQHEIRRTRQAGNDCAFLQKLPTLHFSPIWPKGNQNYPEGMRYILSSHTIFQSLGLEVITQAEILTLNPAILHVRARPGSQSRPGVGPGVS